MPPAAAGALKQWLGGIAMVLGCIAATAVGAQLENDLASLFAVVGLAALAMGMIGMRLGVGLVPAAVPGLVVVLAGGAAWRQVLPLANGVTTTNVAGVTTHPEALGFRVEHAKLVPALGRTWTSRGGKFGRPKVHRVVPLVDEAWRPGDVVAVWVVDPPTEPTKPSSAIRISWVMRSEARAAVGDEHAVVLALDDDPVGTDARRWHELLIANSAAVLGWAVGYPLVLALRTRRRE